MSIFIKSFLPDKGRMGKHKKFKFLTLNNQKKENSEIMPKEKDSSKTFQWDSLPYYTILKYHCETISFVV